MYTYSEADTPKDEHDNFVTAHMKAAATECIPNQEPNIVFYKSP